MTTCRWVRILGASAFIAALALHLRAQQAPTPQGVIRINVNLVQVDAVVTDAKGRPVRDLKAEDFEVLQDGQPQKITNFEFIKVRDLNAMFDPVIVMPPRNRSVPPPPQTTALRRDQIHRTIALVVDDLGLSFDSIVRIRESLKKWVDNEMQPGDLVAIVRTSAGMGSLQRFTLDKQTLHAAIGLIQSHWGRVGVSSFQAVFGASPTDGVLDTSVFDDEVQHAYLVGSLGAIQYVIRGLRDLPGRKSMILFSESMRFTYLEPGLVATASLTNTTGEEHLRKLVDEANRSSVVIYAIDPRGVINTGLTAEDNTTGLEDDQVRAAVNNRATQLIESRDGMFELTRRTGGLFVHDSNDVGDLLRRAVDDGDGYYLIGYQPESSTFDDGTGKTKFHSISVRVKRAGLSVRSRSGFFGRSDTPPLTDAGARRAQLANALVSPFASGDVGVHLTGLFYPSDAEGAFIRALFHFDANDVTFAEEPDGSRSASVDLIAVTFDADGQQVDTTAKSFKIGVSKEAYPEILKTGLVYSLDVAVKKPGGYQLRAVLRDTASQRLGSAMQFVNVPDVKNGRLTLSGIAIASERSQTQPLEPQASPARRIFKQGAGLVYAYQILNARTDADKKTQLDTQIRLFRNGQEVYEGNAQELKQEGPVSNPKRLVATGRVQLSKLAPGNYVLQIVVSDNNRYDNYRIAAQSIDFEVQQ